MAFEQAYPIFALGPRTDLNVVYAKFIVSSTGTVLTPTADSCPGITIASSGSGVYVLTHPKCRFRSLDIQVLLPTIATVASRREVVQHVGVAGTDTAKEGILNFNTQNQDATPIVAVLIDDSEVQVMGLLGF